MTGTNGEDVDEKMTKAAGYAVGEEKPKDFGDPERSANNKKKWILLSIAALLVIAAAITTGVVVSKNNKDSSSSREKSTGRDPVVTDGEPTKLEFAETKSTIDYLCGEGTTLDECQEKCEDVPDCCSYDGECLDGTEEWKGCVSYAKCHVVKGLTDPAPSDLATLCAASDLSECEKACKEVECCYKDEVECDSPFYFLTCLDYAPCQNLRENIRVAPAADGLEELCSPYSEDRDLCEEECKKADCCWSTDLEGANSNCLESDFVACLTHASCGFLAIPEANVVVPAAPDDLFNNTCAPDKILEDGPERDACQKVCDDAECCGNLNMTDGTDSCFLDDPFGCAAYAPCALLPLTGGEVPLAPEDLAETCSWTSFEDPEKEKACERACDDARCCWDGDENCFADGNVLACFGYAPCAILLISGGDVPIPTEAELGEACSRESYEQNPDTCKSYCNDGVAGCCFEEENLEDNCFIENFDTCSLWLAGGCFRNAFN